jgi:hypothetical protein
MQGGPLQPRNLQRYGYALNNPVTLNDPSGHAVPCSIATCRSKQDISSWPQWQRDVVGVACLIIGSCHISGDTLHFSPSLPGPGTGLGSVMLKGQSAIAGIDTIQNGAAGKYRIRLISAKLTTSQKDALRAEARSVYDQLKPGVRPGNYDIHHRIPLEYAHLTPYEDPNRIQNLIALPNSVHKQINQIWASFSQKLQGRIPTLEEVQAVARDIESRYGQHYR